MAVRWKIKPDSRAWPGGLAIRGPQVSGENAVKTTVKVPDKLYRRAKAEAALRGCTLEELIEEGLRLVLRPLPRTRRLPSLAQLTKGACGVVDSGVSDLASNSQHLADFGRHARRHR